MHGVLATDHGGRVTRVAERDDLPAILGLLSDDAVESSRSATQSSIEVDYWAAFEEISANPSDELVVLVSGATGAVIGTLQLTFIRCLNWRAGLRAQIQAVRIDESCRGAGVGSELITWAVERARSRGCVVIQLATSKGRASAHQFYRRLGFEPTHEGFKMRLDL